MLELIKMKYLLTKHKHNMMGVLYLFVELELKIVDYKINYSIDK